MKVLLDTHTFLWAMLDDPRLSANAAQVILDSETGLYLSAVSAWEITIKYAKGSLELPRPPAEFIPAQIQENALTALPIQLMHVLHIASLPPHHADPFDRLLIAQAQVEGIPIITGDPHFAKYDVEVIW